jgi:hypothetical protein
MNMSNDGTDQEEPMQLMTQQAPSAPTDGKLISIRKLAALDVVFHGPKLILAEFAVGVFLPLGLGVVFVIASRLQLSFESLLGGYLLCIALNYVPLLLYTIGIARQKNAAEIVALELAQKDRYTRKYSGQSLLLLVPLVVLLLALFQERQKRSQQ